MTLKRNLLSVAIASALFAVPASDLLAQPASQAGSAAPMQLAQAQQAGTIQGRVTDEGTGASLQGAIVEIPALNISTTVNTEGRFTLLRVPAGSHSLVVRYIDRETQEAMVAVQSSGTVAQNFALRRLGSTATAEEIVVYGRMIADAEAAALQRQLAANNVGNVLASDSIGRFPDQNAADALGRVPGISIERDQGQARYVNVRGAPAEFSSIAFNGVAAPTPSQGGRSARFDTISNDVIKSIEVVKAVTPDRPADSIGGFINVETKGAFDYEGFKIDAAIAHGTKELGGGALEQYQITASNTFFNDTVGVLVSGSVFTDNKLTDSQESRWRVENDGQVWSRHYDQRPYELVRENQSMNVKLDWRPVENLELYANYIASEFTDFEIRNLIAMDMDDSHYGHIRSRTGYDASVSSPLKGTVLGINVDANFNTRTDLQSVASSQLGGVWTADTMTVSWVGGFNRSESIRGRDSAYFQYLIPRYAPTSATDPTPRNPSVSMTYDYTDPDFPQIGVFTTAVNADGTLALGQRLAGVPIDALQLRDVEISDTKGQVDDVFFNFDVEMPWMPFGVSSDLKFGGRVSQRNATLRDTDLEVNASQIGGLNLDTSFSQITNGRMPTSNFPMPAMFVSERDKSLPQRQKIFDAASSIGAVWTQDNVWRRFYDVDENNSAAYLMNTFHFDQFDIIAGIRVEKTEMSGRGISALDRSGLRSVLRSGGEKTLADLFAARDASGSPLLEYVDAKTDYIDWYPALHINYRPLENLVFRLAYTESILRPSYSQFAPNRSIGEDSDLEPGGTVSISGGNPGLKPYYSRNVDAYAEYYMPYRGILSLGFFAKRIDDPIFNATQTVDGAPFGFPNNDVRLSGPLNGSDARINGVEFNYSQQFGFLPEPWDGFGASFNYTYSDDSAKTPPLFNPATGLNDGFSRETGLSGASSTTYNASVFFEKFGVSTRLAYQYRSTWVNTIDLGNPELDRFWDDRPSLDLSFRYSISENWMLLLDANNLTNEFGRRYNGDRSNVYEIESFGRSYMAGVRMSF